MIKRFFSAGLSSGTRLRRPASGYESRNVKVSLTSHLLLYDSVSPNSAKRHTFIWRSSQNASSIVERCKQVDVRCSHKRGSAVSLGSYEYSCKATCLPFREGVGTGWFGLSDLHLRRHFGYVKRKESKLPAHALSTETCTLLPHHTHVVAPNKLTCSDSIYFNHHCTRESNWWESSLKFQSDDHTL